MHVFPSHTPRACGINVLQFRGVKNTVDFFLLQWNLLIRTPSGPAVLSFVERLSSFRSNFLYSAYTRVLSGCPLLGGLSSFGVSFLGGFTVLWSLRLSPASYWFHRSVGGVTVLYKVYIN